MDWKKEIQKLAWPYSTIDLLVDGHKVTYQSGVSKMKIYIQYFYDEKTKGEYLSKESDVGKLFGYPKFGKVDSAHYKFLKKYKGKKVADEYANEAKAKVLYYDIFWPSPAKIIKHLSRFKQIEVLETKNTLNFPF